MKFEHLGWVEIHRTVNRRKLIREIRHEEKPHDLEPSQLDIIKMHNGKAVSAHLVKLCGKSIRG
jgi:hypothetical protein